MVLPFLFVFKCRVCQQNMVIPDALTYLMLHCMPACMVDIDGASGNAGDFNIKIVVNV